MERLGKVNLKVVSCVDGNFRLGVQKLLEVCW